MKNELEGVPIRQYPRLRLVEETERHRAIADATGVDAAAVVRDLDLDEPTRLPRSDHDRSRRALARLNALFGALDAVTHRIAEQVHERVLDELENALVDLRLRADELEGGLLALLRATSRTRRWKPSRIVETGSIRAFLMSSCRLSTRIDTCMASRPNSVRNPEVR